MNERWINLMQSEGATFEAGRVVSFPNTANFDNETAICDLSHYGVIAVSGEDAAHFLQAQLTNDVLALPDGGVQWNGWCSPKGRLLTTFLIFRDANRYILLLPRSLQPAIQKRLGMFVLRSKVKIEDISATMLRFGLIASIDNTNLLPSKMTVMTSQESAFGRVIRISTSRYIVLADSNVIEMSWHHFRKHAKPATAALWDLAAIREGIVEVTVETQDTYVPQMVNFELIGAVNFKKGCYPGQEIVARTQYRGILKRRMMRVAFTSTTPPLTGASIYSPAFPDQAAGSIALIACIDNQCEALVVAQIDAISSDCLFLDPSYTQKLVLCDLPYNVFPTAGL